MGFQKGQRIRAIRYTESAYGHRFAKGRELVVTNPDMYGRPSSHPHHRLGVNTPDAAAETPSASEWVVNPADFELVELDPLKVKAGDTVTLTLGKAILTDEVRALRPSHDSRQWRAFELSQDQKGESPRAVKLDPTADIDAWTLTAHQPAPEPEPVPPTKAGSFVLANGLSGLPKVPLFLTQHGWVTRYGSRMGWTVEVLQSRGFEVIHDAGKDAS